MKYNYYLEMGISIARFMFDHAICLNAILPSDRKEIIAMFEEEQKIYGELVINFLDNNILSKDYQESNILATSYTERLEYKTSTLFNIEINNNVTKKSIKNNSNISKEINIINNIEILNKNLLMMLNFSLSKYYKLKQMIEDNEVIMFFNINIVNHFIEEVRSFIYTMEFVTKKLKLTPTYLYSLEYNINNFSYTHLKIIKQMANQINPLFIVHCDETAQGYKKMCELFNNKITPETIEKLKNNTLLETKKYLNWYDEFTSSLVYKNYYNTFISLFFDHVLRETNYYYYILNKS